MDWGAVWPRISNGGGLSAVLLTRTGPPKDVKGETVKSYVTRMASSILLLFADPRGFSRWDPMEWLVTFMTIGCLPHDTQVHPPFSLHPPAPRGSCPWHCHWPAGSRLLLPFHLPVLMMGDTGMVTVNVMNSGPDSEYINSAQALGWGRGHGYPVTGPDPGRDLTGGAVTYVYQVKALGSDGVYYLRLTLDFREGGTTPSISPWRWSPRPWGFHPGDTGSHHPGGEGGL